MIQLYILFPGGSAVSPPELPGSHLLKLRFALALLHMFLQIFRWSRPKASDLIVGCVGAQHLPPKKKHGQQGNPLQTKVS